MDKLINKLDSQNKIKILNFFNTIIYIIKSD